METRESKRASPTGLTTSLKNQYQNEQTLRRKRPRRSTSSSPKNNLMTEIIDGDSIDDMKESRLSKTSISETPTATNLQEMKSPGKGPLSSTDIDNAPENDASNSAIIAPVGVSLPWYEQGGPVYKRPPSLLWDAPKDVDRTRKGERNRKRTTASDQDSFGQSKRRFAKKHFAGLQIPSKTIGVCAECGMDGEEDSSNNELNHGNVIVLCDGPGCDREFHLRCCRPPLQQVPEGDFFCFDCHPNGGYAVTLLEEYLDEMEDRRDAHNYELLNEEDLLPTETSSSREDGIKSKHLTDGKSSSPHSANAMSTPNRRARRTSQGKNDGTTPTWESDSNGNINPVAKRKRKHVSDSFTFVDKLIYEDLDENQPDFLSQIMNGICSEADGKGPPRSELDVFHRDKLMNNDDPMLVGCAVRLYCPKTNHYQTGRILKVREPPENKDPNTFVSEDYDRTNDTECLVRFQAGRDFRKKSLTRWIRLEEHSLAVACPHLVWGKFLSSELEGSSSSPSNKKKRKSSSSPSTPRHRWVPTKLWMRSSRELVMSMQLLDESLGQISYRDFRQYRRSVDFATNTSQSAQSTPNQRPNTHVNGENGKHHSNSKAATPTNGSSSKSKSYLHQEWILAECIGREVYKLVHVPMETKDYSCDDSSTSPKMIKQNGSDKKSPRKTNAQNLSLKSREKEVMFALVQAEQKEQDRVKAWNTLPLQSAWHEKALTILDEYALGPLAFDASYHKTNIYRTQEEAAAMQIEKHSDEEEKSQENIISIEPTPLVRTGLDRMYILEQFVNHFNQTQETNDVFANATDDMVFGTKDMAVSLSSELVSNHSITACIQQQNRIARLRQSEIRRDTKRRKSPSKDLRVSSSLPVLSSDLKENNETATVSEQELNNNHVVNGDEITEAIEKSVSQKTQPISQSPTSSTGILPLAVSNGTKAKVLNGTMKVAETMLTSTT